MPYRLLTFTLFIFISIPFSLADTIVLKNGDRISGTLVKKETDKVIFNTDYAGDISIAWTAIETLNTDKPVQVMLEDKTFIKGTLQSGGKDLILLQGKHIPQPIPISLADVQYLNPSPEIRGDTYRVKGRINGGINITDGNTETQQYNLDAEIIVRSIKNRLTTDFSIYQAEDNGVESANQTSLGFKYDNFISKKNYLYGITSFMKDKFKDLNLRSTIGFGYGHQFLDSEQQSLSLEGGVNYVNDDFIASADEDYAAGRWALKFDHWVFKNKTQFFHRHEGLMDLGNAENLTLATQTGLRFPLIKGFNASTQINADWDNTPAPGAEKTDLKYLFNIGYAW